jgi:serine/threonine protein kinase
MSKKSVDKDRRLDIANLPAWALNLAEIGKDTATLVEDYFKQNPNSSLFNTSDQLALKSLGDALAVGWSDAEAARVVKRTIESFVAETKLDVASLARWVRQHPNNADAVLDCLSVEVPEELSIIKVLSRAGSQKLVFSGTWRLTQSRVVVKKLTGSNATKVLERELRTSPLSMKHPNIIETHHLRNSKGEVFLVERHLPEVLSDSWRSNGIQEAANLLYNIADALAFMHERGLVHGDVKPDNIGRDGGAYILLDFGICRLATEFVKETTATGSLRTRAPELLTSNSYEDSRKVDVWALGATVFNVLLGRFPLVDVGEAIPRISHPEERASFERLLATRVETEWDRRVDLQEVPETIRPMLELALRKDPRDRCSATQLKEKAEKHLAAFLRNQSRSRFSPIDEFEQISNHFPPRRMLDLMPTTERENLRKRLGELSEMLGPTEHEQAEKLIRQLANA